MIVRRFIYDAELGRCVEVSTDYRGAPRGPEIIMRHPNISYASPITGEAITNWDRRDRDMKESGSIDFREAKEMAADARRNMKSPTHGLTLQEVERHMR